MRKIILVNPVSSSVINSKKYRRGMSALPPLGMAYLAAVLEKKGIAVKILDQYATMMTNGDIFQIIREENPQVVGFSCLTPVMDNVATLVKAIRQAIPGLRIVLGNIHPTIFADEILRAGIADIIVKGEGEGAIADVVSFYDDPDRLSRIDNISFRYDGKIFHNRQSDTTGTLDSLPYPAWHLFDINNYAKYSMLGLYRRILPLQASRGCPNKCVYCSQDKVHEKCRYRSIENVINEIEFLHEKFGIDCVGYNDAYFPFSETHGFEFCEAYIARGLHRKVEWLTETRVDRVSFELLKRMKEAGLCLIMYGFESGNQGILDNLGKKTTLFQAKKAMEYTRKLKVRSVGFFMLGLPGETQQTCRDTIRFAKDLNCDIAKFNITVPYPGSKLFDMSGLRMKALEEPEKFTSWYDWLSNGDGDIIYKPDGIADSNDLLNLQRKAMFEFYMRPKIIFRHILGKSFSFADMFFGSCILVRGYIRIVISRIEGLLRKIGKVTLGEEPKDCAIRDKK